MRAPTFVAVTALAFVAGYLRLHEPEGRGTLARECMEGARAESCETLADRLERGGVPTRFPEEPGLYLSLACAGGREGACTRTNAWAKRYDDYELYDLDVGCMLRKSAFACEELAGSLRDEGEEASDSADADTAKLVIARARMAHALELHLVACAADHAESCLGASRIYDGGFGVAWYPREARALEAKACTLGLATACEQQGDHASGSEAIALYRQACELTPGSPHACMKAARAEEAAGASPADVAASYRRACDRLVVDACVRVSSL